MCFCLCPTYVTVKLDGVVLQEGNAPLRHIMHLAHRPEQVRSNQMQLNALAPAVELTTTARTAAGAAANDQTQSHSNSHDVTVPGTADHSGTSSPAEPATEHEADGQVLVNASILQAAPAAGGLVNRFHTADSAAIGIAPSQAGHVDYSATNSAPVQWVSHSVFHVRHGAVSDQPAVVALSTRLPSLDSFVVLSTFDSRTIMFAADDKRSTAGRLEALQLHFDSLADRVAFHRDLLDCRWKASRWAVAVAELRYHLLTVLVSLLAFGSGLVRTAKLVLVLLLLPFTLVASVGWTVGGWLLSYWPAVLFVLLEAVVFILPPILIGFLAPLSAGARTGIAIGYFVGMLLLQGLCFCLFLVRNKPPKDKHAGRKMEEEEDSTGRVAQQDVELRTSPSSARIASEVELAHREEVDVEMV